MDLTDSLPEDLPDRQIDRYLILRVVQVRSDTPISFVEDNVI